MNVKRILIFNVNWLGDVLFSTAVIRNVRRNFPGSFIACIIPSRCYQVLKDNPNLDELIIFDEHDRHRGLLDKLRFVRQLKKKNFDAVFLLHRSLSRALICWLAGIPRRFGYDTKNRGFLLTKRIPAPDPNAMHRIDYYLNVIDKAGLRVEDRFPDIFYSEEDESASEQFLNKHQIEKKDFLVGLNPGGNWAPKRWPKERWARLADRIIEEFKAEVIITGGHNDITLAQDIKNLMKEKPISSCGVLNLKQSGALFKRLDLFITADTGPLHIANASATRKIIAIFGPTSADITGPYPLNNVIILCKDVGCRIPCYVVNCADNRCMKAVGVDEVMEQIRLLRK
jgi:lipopolysaccharide heptosyltransferase II